jgi:hypothetical protein
MTLIPSILRKIRTYYKNALGNENACGNEVLVSRIPNMCHEISVIYSTGVDKHIYIHMYIIFRYIFFNFN